MSRKRTARRQNAGEAGKGNPGGPRAPKGGSARSAGSSARRKSARRFGGGTWMLLGLGVLLVLGSVRALSGGSGPDAGLPREGSHAPGLKVKTLDGDHISLSDLRGKVVLVNFWATWCPPCRAEMPSFEQVWRERQKDGFVVLGLSADEDGSGPVSAFLQDRGVTYPVAMATASAKRAFGGATALPASFLIDKQGVVRRTVTGVFDERLLRQDVNRLLAER